MKLKYLLYAVLGCCSWTACSDEDSIVDREFTTVSRYEFPQGTNEWDKTAEEIRESHGVYLIYKGYSQVDFSRGWTVSSETNYFGEALNDDQVSFHMKFMKEHVFQYVPAKLTRTVVPLYYFLIYNYRTEQYMSYNNSIKKTPLTNYIGGMDFWASSILSEANQAVPTDKEKLREYRVRILKCFFETMVLRGRINIPASFKTEFDYKTAITSYPPTDPNYSRKRGFLGSMSGDSYTIVDLGPYYLKDYTPEVNFYSYVNACMRYTESEFLKVYPEADYPKIVKMRKVVIDYMKEKYGIDLNAIAQGPEV